MILTHLKVTVEKNNEKIFFNFNFYILLSKKATILFLIVVCSKVAALVFSGIQRHRNVNVRSFLSFFYKNISLLSKPTIFIITITRITNIVLMIFQC